MAISVTGYEGVQRPSLLPAVGSFCPLIPFIATVSGTTTSETITFSNLAQIKGAVIFVLTSGAVATADAAVSWSGNVLTIADGGATFNLDAASQTIYGLVWGTPRA